MGDVILQIFPPRSESRKEWMNADPDPQPWQYAGRRWTDLWVAVAPAPRPGWAGWSWGWSWAACCGSCSESCWTSCWRSPPPSSCHNKKDWSENNFLKNWSEERKVCRCRRLTTPQTSFQVWRCRVFWVYIIQCCRQKVEQKGSGAENKWFLLRNTELYSGTVYMSIFLRQYSNKGHSNGTGTLLPYLSNCFNNFQTNSNSRRHQIEDTAQNVAAKQHCR